MQPLSLSEYATAVFEDVRLSPDDQRLLAGGALDRMLRIRELAGDRLEVRTKACVGVVRLDACEIRIEPKYLGGGLDVLRMLDYAWGGTGRLLPTGQDFADGPNLRDLVALMVTEHCERLLRHGVRRDYVTREDDLRAVRGRLLADEQVLRHHGRLDRLACRFEEHDADIADNRLCAAAVERAARTAGSPAVRARARRAASQFGPLAPTPLGDLRQVLSTRVYHRHNAHYRAAHLWAGLLLSGGGVDGLFTTGPLASRAFLLDMNGLFEAFVTRLLSEGSAGSGLTVDGQSRQRRVLVDEDTGKPYSEVRPDVLIHGEESGGSVFRLPVDAKYKLYAKKKLSTGDLYQAFLYAHALGSPPVCVLLYPGGSGDARPRISVRDFEGAASARVRAVPVDLRAVLADLAGAHEGSRPREAATRLWREVVGEGAGQPPK